MNLHSAAQQLQRPLVRKLDQMRSFNLNFGPQHPSAHGTVRYAVYARCWLRRTKEKFLLMAVIIKSASADPTSRTNNAVDTAIAVNDTISDGAATSWRPVVVIGVAIIGYMAWPVIAPYLGITAGASAVAGTAAAVTLPVATSAVAGTAAAVTLPVATSAVAGTAVATTTTVAGVVYPSAAVIAKSLAATTTAGGVGTAVIHKVVYTGIVYPSAAAMAKTIVFYKTVAIIETVATATAVVGPALPATVIACDLAAGAISKSASEGPILINDSIASAAANGLTATAKSVSKDPIPAAGSAVDAALALINWSFILDFFIFCGLAFLTLVFYCFIQISRSDRLRAAKKKPFIPPSRGVLEEITFYWYK